MFTVTLKEIANELKCSPAVVSNIQRDAFTKLKSVKLSREPEYDI